MILTLISGFALYTGRVESEVQLSKLGKVSAFVDPFPIGRNEYANSRFYYITNDGKRFYHGRSGENEFLHTWKRDVKEVFTAVGYSVMYNLVSKKASTEWSFIKGDNRVSAVLAVKRAPKQIEARIANVSRFVRIIGPFSDNRMAFFSSEMGDYGVVATSFFWIDVARRGLPSAGLPVFERRQLEFVDFDAPRRTLIVRTMASRDATGKVIAPGAMLAYSLAPDFRTSKRIPLDSRYNGRYQGRHSLNYRWDVTFESRNAKEIDRRTGKATSIPISPTLDSHFFYVGNDLFVNHSNPQDRSDQGLSRWDRSRQQLERVGSWVFAGQSPNGQYLIVRKFGPPTVAAEQFLIRRSKTVASN